MKTKKRKSHLEETIFNRIRWYGCKLPEREYKFHPVRKWRFDFAWPDEKVAIEAEGGIWTNGAHTRGKHFNSDSQKYNAAVILGWRVLRYTTNTINNLEQDLEEIFK